MFSENPLVEVMKDKHVEPTTETTSKPVTCTPMEEKQAEPTTEHVAPIKQVEPITEPVTLIKEVKVVTLKQKHFLVKEPSKQR